MFASIMSVDPPVNKHHEKVKREAETWIIKTLKLKEEEARKIPKMDLAYVASIWVPDADEEGLRMVVDWLYWIFFFDDQFDEGHLKDDPKGAKEEISATLSIMTSNQAFIAVDEYPLRHVFQSTWTRFQTRTSPALQKRWVKSLTEYCDGLLGQVTAVHDTRELNTDEYMTYRRLSIGAFPCHELVEYAHGFEIPQVVADNDSVKVCRTISTDLVWLQNDVLSYRKDLIQGVKHNIIHVLRNQNLSEQQAIDEIGEMLDERYREWYRALAEMPIWGEKVDRDVLKYIWGCQAVALGNLHWSYKTGRYLGAEGEQIRTTRIMTIPNL
ncbi:hypothetical protein M406DRAFT_65720 [Cryphonectria parasitica EP155]|uniref:Terpene synthase n=1 Tax=Cryphonectria parasitica (strain ATCC 38755 / EP155) TaxID=660469 RepID=A0A9P5CKX6_CRYP1|nr:uncharacterized protein M406DRAFT_65720 [Cryphonectria parasitica EP155]KAF3761240.1 hypothetical protein M406DRAFT_65720 [Cryphonectria parasitica EP155]